MKLLADHELLPLVDPSEPNRIIFDFDPPSNWNSKDSPVQPSSIDLHIGEIFYPGVEIGNVGSVTSPRQEGELHPGQTAVVTTFEQVKLPSNIAAIGFPPSSVSGQGILMTNPGHVDPGFHGCLRFTLINMGKHRFHLKNKGAIVTLLLFKLDATGSHYPYGTRNPGLPILQPTNDDIDRLSTDFVDFKAQAAAIAKVESAKVLDKAENALSEAKNLDSKARRRDAIIGLIITILGISAGLWQTLNFRGLEAKTDVLAGQIETLKSSANYENRIKQLENKSDLTTRVNTLENSQQMQGEIGKLQTLLDKKVETVRVNSDTEISSLRMEVERLKTLIESRPR